MPETPASRGFRWPAEWEPHAATWLAWPHNPETWPGCLEAATHGFVEIVRALQGRERVEVLVGDAAGEERARTRLAERGVDPDRGIAFPHVPTNDSWLRDTAPVFLKHAEDGRVAPVDFRFDAWGGKYPPWDLDDTVPSHVERLTGLPRFRADFVLEGGSIDGNGRGAVLTTESCLLNPNREVGRTREVMEQRLADWLGATHVLWLGDGIEGDDTDGHVDDLARFVEPGTVVTAVEDDRTDANHAVLAENLQRLRRFRDQDGKPLSVATLPMPPAVRAPRTGDRCPATYANFYLANGVALVPTFDAPTDERALAALREILVGRDVVGVPCEALVVGLGAVHCLSQQQPR